MASRFDIQRRAGKQVARPFPGFGDVPEHDARGLARGLLRKRAAFLGFGRHNSELMESSDNRSSCTWRERESVSQSPAPETVDDARTMRLFPVIRNRCFMARAPDASRMEPIAAGAL